MAKLGNRNNIQAPVWETVLSWIKGEVIAPANHLFFDALSHAIPYFRSVHQSFREGGEFKEAYEYFLKVRKGVTAYIAGISNIDELNEEVITREAEHFYKNELDPKSLRMELIADFEKTSGIRYDKLTPLEKNELNLLIVKTMQEIYDNVVMHISDESNKIRRLQSKINEELQ